MSSAWSLLRHQSMERKAFQGLRGRGEPNA
jgi:hypothetical protein